MFQEFAQAPAARSEVATFSPRPERSRAKRASATAPKSARAVVGQDHVGGAHEPVEDRDAVGRLQIQHDGLLRAPVHQEAVGRLRLRQRGQLVHLSVVVALGRLHLDDFGAKVGEHGGRRRYQHHRGRLDHADPLEQHGRIPPSAVPPDSSTMAAVSVERPSVCPLDCPDTCSLTVTVEEDRIVEIRGSHAHPYTGGVLCAKVPQAYPEFVHWAGRLRTPLRRVGARGEGRFERITWGEALDAIHARFGAIIAAHGPEAILPLNYAGPHGMLAGGSMDLRFFHKLRASLLDRRPLCGGIRTEAWVGTFGPVPGIRPEQVADARLIVVWGNNVTWSNLHLVPWINRARKAGARLVVVDPRRTVIARRADLHIALRPGPDVLLAWAVAAELERRDGIDRAFVERHVEGFEEFMALARRSDRKSTRLNSSH